MTSQIYNILNPFIHYSDFSIYVTTITSKPKAEFVYVNVE